MTGKRFWEIGGFVAGAILIAFGVVAIYMGVDGRSTVRDSLKAEQITFGTADDPAGPKYAHPREGGPATPASAKYADRGGGEQVTTGEQARAFAKIMHEHALEGSGGLTYAQMGRYVSADNPDDPAGTRDAAAAVKGEAG